MTLWRIAWSLVSLASLAMPQELAPGVLLLARMKSHMREELARVPNYTCLETISRFHAERGLLQNGLKPLDTVRLEVVYSDHREWYGSPGDRSLQVDNPAGFVGSGLIGTGVFAITLHNVLAAARFVFKGDESLGGRTAVKYDFQLDSGPTGLKISMEGGSGAVGENGSIWVDPQSLDLIRIEAYADDIPRYLPLAEESTIVQYARTNIGDSSALLAQQADMRLLETAGTENYDHYEFTHCRAFSAESTISFGEEPKEAASMVTRSASTDGTANEALPALLLVTVQLTTQLTSEDAVGKLIEGKVAGDVVRKGKIVIPNGALVRGRIRRLERYLGNAKAGQGEFIVGLEFTEVETPGGSLPFYADLMRMDPVPGVKAVLSENTEVRAGNVTRTAKETITLPELPGVASFFVSGATFALPAGLRTIWRTRGPIRGK